MHEGHGRTDRPGNLKGVYISARTGSKGNRESHRVDIPKTVHQSKSNTGRSARPGNDTPMGIPPNPTRHGGAAVPTGGVPGKTSGKFQQAGVRY